MTRLDKVLPGDRIALLCQSVGPNRHLGTIAEVTATSIAVHIDGLLRPKQFNEHTGNYTSVVKSLRSKN